jgi:threonine/homoserine/homoserine lactone efflux protein
VLNQAIGDLLPAAAAVALSPIPIVAIVLVLDSPNARKNGPAFALGWVAGLAIVSTLVVVIAGGASNPDSDVASGVQWGTTAIGVLFLAMAAQQWKKRPRKGETAKMPSWMATIESVSWTKAAVLGVALSGANPKNVALTLAASASIAQAGLDTADTALAVAIFVAIGSLTVVGSVLFYLVAPRRAEGPLASIKQFMAANNATIMMVVLLLLGAKFVGDGLAGIWA